MRTLYCVSLMAMASPAFAGDAPYYGPMKLRHGIGFVKFGYKDTVEKDGTWHVEVATRRGEPVDMAMYRAAEMAREQGYAYIEFLGGSASNLPGNAQADVYARPSHSAALPTACRSKRRGTCYTANVAEVLRVLGGPGGTQPGVAIVDHRDEYGREVRLSGFGIGDATHVPTPAGPPPRYVAPPRRPQPSADRSLGADRAPAAVAKLGARINAAQPIRGREPTLGWTIGD